MKPHATKTTKHQRKPRTPRPAQCGPNPRSDCRTNRRSNRPRCKSKTTAEQKTEEEKNHSISPRVDFLHRQPIKGRRGREKKNAVKQRWHRIGTHGNRCTRRGKQIHVMTGWQHHMMNTHTHTRTHTHTYTYTCTHAHMHIHTHTHTHAHTHTHTHTHNTHTMCTQDWRLRTGVSMLTEMGPTCANASDNCSVATFMSNVVSFNLISVECFELRTRKRERERERARV